MENLFNRVFCPEVLENPTSAVMARRCRIKRSMMRHVLMNGPQTILQINSVVNLSIPTVSKIVYEMVEEQMFLDFGHGESSGGRKPSVFGINPDCRNVLVVEVSRRQLRLALMNFFGEYVSPLLVEPIELASENHLVARVVRLMDKALRQTGIPKSRVVGAGIAFPGLVDNQTFQNRITGFFEGQPLHNAFAEALGMPIVIEDCARAITLGEYHYGAGRHFRNLLCINVGAGLGLGMVINSRFYRGHHGYSGEFGHTLMSPGTRPCYCGQVGCYETFVTGPELEPKYLRLAELGRQELIAETPPEKGIEVGSSIQADRSIDPLVMEALESLGQGAGKLINIFDPEAIVICGVFCPLPKLEWSYLLQCVSRFSLPAIFSRVKLLQSSLYDKGVLLGGFSLVMERLFESDSEKNANLG